MASLSYACHTSAAPLLGETIGANLERTAARVPDRPALVSRHQGLRFTYAELDAEVDGVAGADRRGAGGRRPCGDLEAESGRVGALAVRDRPCALESRSLIAPGSIPEWLGRECPFPLPR